MDTTSVAPDIFICCGSLSLWYYCESLALALSLSSQPRRVCTCHEMAYPHVHNGNWLSLNYSITFLGALIYGSVIYHRHRRAKCHFHRSFQDKELFPVMVDETSSPVVNNRALQAPRNSIKELAPGVEVPDPAEMKEAVEVTVLRELGGGWELYELPATKSVRSSRGAKSVRSLKGTR